MDACNEHFNDVENAFVMAYSSHLMFKDSYTSSSLMRFCETLGTRIDRVLVCENLCAQPKTTLTLGYTYRYFGEPSSLYRAIFTFDCVHKGSRCLWVHRNECHVPSYLTHSSMAMM
jgi:hypothetical protein